MSPALLTLALALATPVAAGANDEVAVRGAVHSSIDGADLGPSDLFDFAGGGLRVVRVDADGVRAVATGAVGPACAAAHVASPCLAPALRELAHARLVTIDEFRASLSGAMIAETSPIPSPLPPPPSRAPLYAFLASLALGLAATIAWLRRRARAATPLGRVYVAANRARRALPHDPTLATARAQIEALVERAEKLEAARRSALAELSRIDRGGIERRREAWARSNGDGAGETLAWLTAESSEAARLTSDLESSIAGLERIAAALRVMALRAREHRGVRARVSLAGVVDPVDALARELDLRDEALRELEV